MHRKPFIKMIPAEKVEWHKPKSRETSRLDEVLKKVVVRRNSQKEQIATNPQRENVKDQ